MVYIYDYISFFVPFVNISVSLGNLFQRIASIYNRYYFVSFKKLFLIVCLREYLMLLYL